MKYEEIAICVIIVRTYSYFEETGRGNSFERFPYLRVLSERLTEDILKEWEQGQSIQAERYWTLLRAIGDGKTVDPVVHTAFDLCLAAMEADNRIFAYLFAQEAGNPEVLQTPVFGEGEWYLCKEPLHPMFIRRKLAEECATWMQGTAFPTVLQIDGNGGRRFLAKNIARLLENFAEWQITEADFWKNVVFPVLDAGVSVFLCTETRFPVYDGYFPGKRVELKALSRKERQQVFEGFSSMYGLTVDCPRYSVHYRLSAKEIARALELWRQYSYGRAVTVMLSGPPGTGKP